MQKRLQKVAELPEQIRFGNRGVFRNKGQIAMLRTPCSEIPVQGTASCNEIAAVDVDDDREFLAVAFLVLRNIRRDGQALITSFRDDVMCDLRLAANSDCGGIGFRLLAYDFLQGALLAKCVTVDIQISSSSFSPQSKRESFQPLSMATP